jgi:hypothetical protein
VAAPLSGTGSASPRPDRNSWLRDRLEGRVSLIVGKAQHLPQTERPGLFAKEEVLAHLIESDMFISDIVMFSIIVNEEHIVYDDIIRRKRYH